jgi:hypothetical protein
VARKGALGAHSHRSAVPRWFPEWDRAAPTVQGAQSDRHSARGSAIGHVASEAMIKYTVRARGRDAVCSEDAVCSPGSDFEGGGLQDAVQRRAP